MVAYAAYRRPTFAKNVARKGARLTGRLLNGAGLRRRARTWSARLISRLGEELRAARRQLAAQPTEAPKLATLALLGVGSEAAIPILGYRLFNFWLPIPLAAVFYPTLRRTG